MGQLGEKALGDLLSKAHIEVKTDFQAQQTGNVFIEYKSRGKLSGISTSEADYWAFVLSNNQIAIITTELLKVKARQKYKESKINGGDNNTSEGVLLRVDTLLT